MKLKLKRLICRIKGHSYRERMHPDWNSYLALHLCERCGELEWK